MAKLRIAIAGGGLASVCLASSLSRRDDIDVKIFEASPTFRDDGAAIGLGSNGQTALRLLSGELFSAMESTGGTRMSPSLRVMMGTGKDQGEHVGDLDSTTPQIILHRGLFLHKIRQTLPQGVIQLGKRLVNVEEHDESLLLFFEDGSMHQTDSLVGCDGINSTVRQVVLGHDHIAAKATYTGGYAHRVVIPISQAHRIFGEDYCAVRTQHGWIGKDGFLLTDLCDDAQAMQVIAGWRSSDSWPYETSFVEWSKEDTASRLKEWGSIGKAMTQVFNEQPALYAAAGRVHLETPFYNRGLMCVAGDAAQTFSPMLGAGAGQAIEDALMLSTLLGTCHSTSDIKRAFVVYDALRRPRRLQTAQASAAAGRDYCGQNPDIGLDLIAQREALTKQRDFLYDYDLARAQEEAIFRMSAT